MKDEEIKSLSDQLENRSSQQRQLLEIHVNEIELYKSQLETRKSQTKQFLEKKQTVRKTFIFI